MAVAICIISVLIGLTIYIAAAGLVPSMGEPRLIFERAPDQPCSFGYKMGWLAVRTKNTRAVVRALGLTNGEPANWNSGIGTVYDDVLGEQHVFVTPPVEGWTFVVSLALPHPVGQTFVDKLTPMLVDLGGDFDEVQYFFSYPLIDFFAWARMKNGRLNRAFATGDEGVIWSKGRITKEERKLGLRQFELRGVKGRKGDAGGPIVLHPTEAHVMELARQWSVDPTTLDNVETRPSLGVIARAPVYWRAERLKKSA